MFVTIHLRFFKHSKTCKIIRSQKSLFIDINIYILILTRILNNLTEKELIAAQENEAHEQARCRGSELTRPPFCKK